MANKFTDSIGERNVAPFVKQPVVDKSEGYGAASDLNTFANAAKISTAIYKDVQKLDALQGITGEIRDEIDAYQTTSPSKILERQEGLQKSEAELAKLPSQEGGSAEDVNRAVNNVLSDIDTQKDYLVKAQSQDRITGFEFDQRVKQILKDKITQYPYLKSEILSHGKTVLDLEGIENRIKLDDKMSTAKKGMDEFFVKEIYKEAKANFINLNNPIYKLPNGDPNWDAINEVNQYIRSAKYADNMLTEAAKRDENIDKLTINRAIKDGTFDNITLARQMDNINGIEGFFTIIDENGKARETLSPTEFSESKAKANKFINEQIARAESEFSKYGLADQEVKARLDRYKERLETARDTIASYKDYSEVKTFIQNQRDITEARVQLNLREKFGEAPEVISMLEKIATTKGVFQPSFTSEAFTTFVENMNRMVNDAANRGLSILPEFNNANPYKQNESMGQSLTKISLSGLSTDSRSLEFANKLISSTTSSFNKPDIPQADQYKAYTELVAGMASSTVTSDDARSISETNRGNVLTSIENVVPVVYQNMQNAIGDKNITIEVDGQGLVVAKGADQQFNNQYVVPLNNSIKTYGKLMALESNKDVLDKLTTQPEATPEPNPFEQPPQVNPNADMDTSQGTNLTTDSIPEGDRGTTTNVATDEGPDMNQVNKKDLDLDFVINELGPKESQQGHRDKAGKLIKSPKGALGQFQILPSTAKDPGFGLPSIDLETSTIMEQAQWVQNYLDKLVSYYRGDKEKALAAYNYGYKNVDKLVESNGGEWKTKLPAETKDYLQSLL